MSIYSIIRLIILLNQNIYKLIALADQANSLRILTDYLVTVFDVYSQLASS